MVSEQNGEEKETQWKERREQILSLDSKVFFISFYLCGFEITKLNVVIIKILITNKSKENACLCVHHNTSIVLLSVNLPLLHL